MSVKSPLGLVLYCYLNMTTINKTYLILSYLILSYLILSYQSYAKRKIIHVKRIILDFGVTSHNVIDQSMIINFEMKKTFGGEAKQNPRDST